MGRIKKLNIRFIIIIFLILLIFACGSPVGLMQRIQEEIYKVSGTNTIVFSLTGAPSGFTNITSIDITVEGNDLTAYKYKLDSAEWSPERDISEHITASGLSEGPHMLKILGKHTSGVWQQDENAETIYWTVDTTAPSLINITACIYSGSAGGVLLQWDNPAENILLLRSAGSVSAPAAGRDYSVGDIIDSSVVVYKGTGSNFKDSSAGEGTWNYQVFAYDAALNYAAGGNAGSTTSFDGFIYVNINSGNNDNSGISTAPKASIQAGITAAKDVNIPAVRIAQGDYSDTGPVVTLAEGVSLYGGYKSGDWNIRDSAAYVTTIQDTDISINTPSTTHRALEAGSGITSATVVDGVSIKGSNAGAQDGRYICAVFIYSGGSPTIQNSILYGGYAGSASETAALIIINSAPVIQDSILHSGNAGNNRGIKMTGAGALIRRNTIDGDSVGGNAAYGIYTEGGTPMIYNNTIYNLNSSSGNTCGIYVNNGTPEIYNNFIDGGKNGSNAVAVYITGGATPDIRNNILSGSEGNSYPSYGIWEDSGKPKQVSNNDFINIVSGGSSGGMYRDSSGQIFNTISTMQDTFSGLPYQGITCSGNTADAPVFAPDGTYRLLSGTPASISEGGLNLSGEGFVLDKDKT
ncbi:MAG: right-handed parallel beta-helix repeat-containing protein, partial [Spirochaetes bacterium]|nr:right-handed parallel beta-helix repeat-containing protein [Spirochaetota bacterium]